MARRTDGTFAKGTSGNPAGRGASKRAIANFRLDSAPGRQVDAPVVDGQATAQRFDGWYNFATGHGVNGMDKRQNTGFETQWLDFDRLAELWRGDDLAARAVETLPKEGTRQGWDLIIPEGEDGPLDEKDRIAEVIDKLDVLGAEQYLFQALSTERGMGGAAILLGVNDGQTDLTKPLDLNKVSSIDWMTPLEARELYPVYGYADPRAPKFGEPEIYRLTSRAVLPPYSGAYAETVMDIHESRLLVFPGIRVSRYMPMASQGGWGDSVLIRMWRVLRDFNLAWGSAGTLVTDFARGVYKLSDLITTLGTTGGHQAIQERLAFMELAASTINASVIDANDDFKREPTPIAGLPDLLDKFCIRLAASAEMPLTLLFGMSPGGLNATGDSDIRLFYDRVASYQKDKILPQLKRLIKIIFLTTGSKKEPKKWSVRFRPLWQESAKDRSAAMFTQSQADHNWITDGVLSAEEVAKAHWGTGEWNPELSINFQDRKAHQVATAMPVPGKPHPGAPGSPENPLGGPPPGNDGGGKLPPNEDPGEDAAAPDADTPPQSQVENDDGWVRRRMDAWDDQLHPRDEAGRFGAGYGTKMGSDGRTRHVATFEHPATETKQTKTFKTRAGAERWVNKRAREQEAKVHAADAKILADVSKKNGGLTYDPRTGTQPQAGYSVAMYPDRTQLVHGAASLDGRAMDAYITKNKDVLDRDPHSNIGTWYNRSDDSWYLDVPHVERSLAHAATLGKERGEKAIWDLKRHEEVKNHEYEEAIRGTGRFAGRVDSAKPTPRPGHGPADDVRRGHGKGDAGAPFSGPPSRGQGTGRPGSPGDVGSEGVEPKLTKKTPKNFAPPPKSPPGPGTATAAMAPDVTPPGKPAAPDPNTAPQPFVLADRADRADWDEGQHPRAADGKFGEGSGSRSGDAHEGKAEATSEDWLKVNPTGNPHVFEAGNKYLREAGLPALRALAPQSLTKEEGQAIASAYDAAKSDPKDAETLRAYHALNAELAGQRAAAERAGYKFEAWDKTGQPYATSKEMMADVRDNKRLYYFKSTEGTTPNGLMTLEQNDTFRAVHDLFGHAMAGNQFGPKGETNAFLDHVQMFTPLARKALATETLGQNAWFNFSKANEGKPVTERRFADQKAFLVDPKLYDSLLGRAAKTDSTEEADYYWACPCHRRAQSHTDDWEEEKHPRAQNGEFGSGGGGDEREEAPHVSKAKEKLAAAAKARDEAIRATDNARDKLGDDPKDEDKKHFQEAVSASKEAYAEHQRVEKSLSYAQATNSEEDAKKLEAWSQSNAELTPVEHAAIAHWQGAGYDKINSELRAGAESADVRERSKALDAAISKHTLPVDTVLERGLKVNNSNAKRLPFEVGATIRDPGFASTTVDDAVASKFSGSAAPGEESVLIRIRAKAGTHLMPCGEFKEYAGERELLLPRGSRFRVASIEQGERRVVTVDLLPPEGVKHLDWDEDQHPRDHGKFASSGGSLQNAHGKTMQGGPGQAPKGEPGVPYKMKGLSKGEYDRPNKEAYKNQVYANAAHGVPLSMEAAEYNRRQQAGIDRAQAERERNMAEELARGEALKLSHPNTHEYHSLAEAQKWEENLPRDKTPKEQGDLPGAEFKANTLEYEVEQRVRALAPVRAAQGLPEPARDEVRAAVVKERAEVEEQRQARLASDQRRVAEQAAEDKALDERQARLRAERDQNQAARKADIAEWEQQRDAALAKGGPQEKEREAKQAKLEQDLAAARAKWANPGQETDAESVGKAYDEWNAAQAAYKAGREELKGPERNSSPESLKEFDSKVVVSVKERPSDSTSETYIAKLDDGTRGLYKPKSGEPGDLTTNGIEQGTFYQHEAAASKVAEILGVSDMVPATAVKLGPSGVGSVQAFAEGAERGLGETGEADEAERMRVFDYITGNGDRHNENVMNKDGHLVMIDNGLTFPKGPPHRFLQPDGVPHDELSADTVAKINAFDHKAFAKTLKESGIGREAALHAVARAYYLKKYPKILGVPQETRHTYAGDASWNKVGMKPMPVYALKYADKVVTVAYGKEEGAE